MPAPLVVPDASVLLKWVLPSDDEPEVDKALLLRAAILNDAVRAIVPALWLYEVGNTVARRFPAHASAWLTSLMKFGLTEAVPSDAWLAAALELVCTYEVSFYDAAYHALAIIRRGVFVTADVRYVNRMAGEGTVIALSEWRAPVRPSSSRL
ncbi:MAG TPA: type II toxin-antitoxin system VapC family toxin [Steroidobacteraceae bacterium]|nr:type II toxin-antitoxin system VapC family toxin [Steroidobacteraceae bacterium]